MEEEKNVETENEKENIPKGKRENLTERMRENPWIISSLVLGLLLLILLVTNFTGFTGSAITGSVISEGEAGNTVLEIAKLQTEDVELVGVNSKNGLYEVILLMDGREIPVYLTIDGENLVQGVIPLSTVQEAQQASQQQESIDWNVFENELPENVKSKILSFNYEEPEVYDEELKINEFKNYELVPKTLIVFYSSGCGWCSKYHPVLVEAMEKYPKMNIYALVLSDNRDIAEKYGITGTPANIINGKYMVSGYRSLEDLSKILDELN